MACVSHYYTQVANQYEHFLIPQMNYLRTYLPHGSRYRIIQSARQTTVKLRPLVILLYQVLTKTTQRTKNKDEAHSYFVLYCLILLGKDDGHDIHITFNVYAVSICSARRRLYRAPHDPPRRHAHAMFVPRIISSR